MNRFEIGYTKGNGKEARDGDGDQDRTGRTTRSDQSRRRKDVLRRRHDGRGASVEVARREVLYGLTLGLHATRPPRSPAAASVSRVLDAPPEDVFLDLPAQRPRELGDELDALRSL